MAVIKRMGAGSIFLHVCYVPFAVRHCAVKRTSHRILHHQKDLSSHPCTQTPAPQTPDLKPPALETLHLKRTPKRTSRRITQMENPMSEARQAKFGSWKSPIAASALASGTLRLGQLKYGKDGLYFMEGRPTEGGRQVIVLRTETGEHRDLIPDPFNARTLVHEYGGGAYAVVPEGICFSNFSDQRLYVSDGSSDAPRPITADDGRRFADALFDASRQRLIAVSEVHTEDEVVNQLVAVDWQSGAVRVLVEGDDFYSTPRLSPDGKFLAWLSWNHPNMPWDGTELWLGELDRDGRIGNRLMVAGGTSESIVQPEWAPDGSLYFVSDRTGWWNFYALSKEEASPNARKCEPVALWKTDAEFAGPQWVFGLSDYVVLPDGSIVSAYTRNGTWSLVHLHPDVRSGVCKRSNFELDYTDFTYLTASPAGDKVAFCAASPTADSRIVELDVTAGNAELIKKSSNLSIDPAYISMPQPIEFPTDNGLTAHAFFYPPVNKEFESSGELPPLLVKCHGGPTGATAATLNLGIQYWTSRGFAVVDVNYGGSTGYGTDYRRRLNGQCGVLEYTDCQNAARYLVERGLVDRERLAITGGSAGGYVVLCALTFGKTFKAGASHFGISDAEALARDTHKFESRYLDTLIGPYPERADLYRARSPINYAERISCPVIFFQGLEDKVVPPNQSEAMVEALKKRGIPVAYVTFEGEQHGFRKAENITRSIEGEFYFYSRIFGFQPADKIDAVDIMNLDKLASARA